MLVLSHADRLRVDLHQLRKRILQTAADGYRSADRKVERRELFARDLARAVHGSAGLRHGHDDHILCAQRLQGGSDKRLGLASCRAVADGYRLRPVLHDYLGDDLARLVRLLHRIDDGIPEKLAGGVQHGDLAAGADAWVDGENALFAERRGEQKVAEVLGEHLNRRAIALLLLLHRHVQLAGGRNQALVCVGRGKPQLVGERACGLHPGILLDAFDERCGVDHKPHEENTLGLSAADRQIPVRRHVRYRLLEIVVLLELRGFRRRLDEAHAGLHDRLCRICPADESANIGDVGDALGADVTSSGKRGGGVLHALGGIDETCRSRLRGFASLRPDDVGEWLQPFLLRYHCACAALWLVGLVEVLERALHHALFDLVAQCVRKLALFVDGLDDRCPALLQFAVVCDALLYLQDLHFIQIAVRLLAVAGDERNRVAVLQKLCDGHHLRT